MLGLLALAGLGACGGSDTPSSAGATVPKATSTTTPADPYAVPPTIDAAYLNKVFAALERVDGDATRLILQSKMLPPPAAQRLASIYGEEEFRQQTNLWLDLVTEGLTGFLPLPGDRATAVSEVVTAKPDCVFVAVKRDYSAITGSVGAGRTIYVELRPLDPVRDKFDFNPTPWMVDSEGYNTDGSVPDNPCAG